MSRANRCPRYAVLAAMLVAGIPDAAVATPPATTPKTAPTPKISITPPTTPAERCEGIKTLVDAAPSLRSLQTMLNEHGSVLGLRAGEEGLLSKGHLISFCVVVEKPIVAGECTRTFGFTRPAVVRMPLERVAWGVHQQHGKKLRLSRIGPALVTMYVADPPKGKRQAKRSKALAVHDLASTKDMIVELCFVDSKLDS